MAEKNAVEAYIERGLNLVREQRQFLRRAFPKRGNVGVAVLSLPRANGKSELSGHILACALDPEGPLHVRGGESILCAGSLTQARYVFKALRRRMGGGESKRGQPDKFGYRWSDSTTRVHVIHEETQTAVRVISSNAPTAMGIVNAPVIVAEECAAWEAAGGALMQEALATSAGKTRQVLVYVGTLSPSYPDTWWPKLVESGSAPGRHVTCISGPEDWPIEWEDVKRCNPLTRVNPLLRATLKREFLEAQGASDKRRTFRAYRLNILSSGDGRDVLLTVQDWQRVIARPVPPREGRPIIALDCGASCSWSGAAAVWPNGRLETQDVATTEAADSVAAGTYQSLCDRGTLHIDTGRRIVDPRTVVDGVLAQWDNPYVLICDRYKYREILDAVDGRVGVVERIPRWRESSEDITALRRMALDGKLAVSPGSVGICNLGLREAIIEHEGSGSMRLLKRRQARSKNDVPAAMILACGEALRMEPSLADIDGNESGEPDLQLEDVEASP